MYDVLVAYVLIILIITILYSKTVGDSRMILIIGLFWPILFVLFITNKIMLFMRNDE